MASYICYSSRRSCKNIGRVSDSVTVSTLDSTLGTHTAEAEIGEEVIIRSEATDPSDVNTAKSMVSCIILSV